MATKAITDTSFQNDVLSSDKPVLVDFWAEWCGPCQSIAPALEEIAQELNGKLKVVKVDIDRNAATPKKYGIRGVPTLMLFKDGQVAATKVGAEPKRKLLDWVNSVI
jgi:thioredoxin 1